MLNLALVPLSTNESEKSLFFASDNASQMNTLGTLNQKIADVAKEKEDEDKEVASSFTKC